MSRERARPGEPARLVVLAGLVAALVIGVAVGGRPALYATGLWIDGGSPTVNPSVFAEPSTSASAPEPEAGEGVVASAAPASDGPAPDPAALAKAINAIDTSKLGTTTGLVLDAQTGRQLYAKGPSTSLIPASTLKLLTGLVALDVLGPDTRFSTRVLSASKGSIVLVGGGDPYLASTTKAYPFPASSAALADQTAKALKAQGLGTVTLGFDESLFTGPAWHPSWPDGYHDQVTTVGALWIDQGRETPTSGVSRTPGAAAAATFAAQLKARGITVRGAPAAAKGSGTQLASVSSLPVRTLVQEVLLHSDNSAAEVLLRHVGRVAAPGTGAGQGASFTGGAAVVKTRLAALGIPSAGVVVADGSGLSRSNRVPATTLAGALRVAAAEPRLRPLVEGLPTAGATGTLGARFYQPAAEPGRGWVHAKTGTLSKVSTLAGVTRTRSGREVVFAFMANNQTDEWGVRNWLDEASSAVTGCRC